MSSLRIFVFALLFAAAFARASEAQATRTRAELTHYLERISSSLIGRSLRLEEKDILSREPDALEIILQGWMDTAFFTTSARHFIDFKLQTGGDGYFAQPGNIMEEIVRNRLPYGDIITRCKSVDGSRSFCDSKAPFSAGVLSTRAFLKSHRSRFNLARAGTLLREFLGKEYPVSSTFEPRVARQSLIPMFQALTGSPEFGNGTACYTCHGQFAPHAQLFVKFDQDGYWAAFVSGQQDPSQEPGWSSDGFYASHFASPTQSKSESSHYYGQPVQNLGDAVKIIRRSPAFYRTAVASILRYYLRMNAASAETLKPKLLDSIVAAALIRNADPSFQDLVAATFTHPLVISSVLKEGAL